MSLNVLSRFTAGALLLLFGNAHAAAPPVPNPGAPQGPPAGVEPPNAAPMT